MGIIEKKLNIIGDKGVENLNVIFDSGSNFSLIKESIAEKICTTQKLPRKSKFEVGDGSIIESEKACVFATELQEDSKKCFVTDIVYVFPDNQFTKKNDMVIGAGTMQDFKIRLQFDNRKKKNRIDLSKCEKFFRA